jgi:hypothetical protein
MRTLDVSGLLPQQFEHLVFFSVDHLRVCPRNLTRVGTLFDDLQVLPVLLRALLFRWAPDSFNSGTLP